MGWTCHRRQGVWYPTRIIMVPRTINVESGMACPIHMATAQ